MVNCIWVVTYKTKNNKNQTFYHTLKRVIILRISTMFFKLAKISLPNL